MRVNLTLDIDPRPMHRPMLGHITILAFEGEGPMTEDVWRCFCQWHQGIHVVTTTAAPGYVQRPAAPKPAATRLADLLEKHPELAPYTRPASEGSVRDVVTKLEEIAELLRRLVGVGDETAALKSTMDRLLLRSV